CAPLLSPRILDGTEAHFHLRHLLTEPVKFSVHAVESLVERLMPVGDDSPLLDRLLEQNGRLLTGAVDVHADLGIDHGPLRSFCVRTVIGDGAGKVARAIRNCERAALPSASRRLRSVERA